MLPKNISVEKTDIRMVGSELEQLLRMFSRAHGGGTPVDEATKKQLGEIIKDYCDTIVQYVDLFNPCR